MTLHKDGTVTYLDKECHMHDHVDPRLITHYDRENLSVQDRELIQAHIKRHYSSDHVAKSLHTPQYLDTIRTLVGKLTDGEFIVLRKCLETDEGYFYDEIEEQLKARFPNGYELSVDDKD